MTPGTPRHQRALRAITEWYAADSRTRAILLFGSLARGNWDAYSDLDLDVVLEDGVAVDMAAELRRLCEALEVAGERAAVILPKRADEGEVVCVSLLELSVRFHPLATTSPNIVESMRLLWGRIALEEIAAAGLANHVAVPELPDILLGRAVRSALEVDVALQRHRLWFAVEMLAAARDALIEGVVYHRQESGDHDFPSISFDFISFDLLFRAILFYDKILSDICRSDSCRFSI